MTYRAYAMDPDGHYKGVHVLASCTTDEQALHAAEQYIDNSDIQVWNLERLVGTVCSVNNRIVYRLGS